MNKLKYFTASWCGPCKFFKPVIKELISEGANIEILDIDENQTLAREYQIMGVPTLVYERNGEVYARNTGLTPKSDIKAMLDHNP